MRLKRVVSAVLATAIVVGWFLWPFSAAVVDPLGSALAAVRAAALLAVTVGVTNVVAACLPVARRVPVRLAIGFGIAFSVTVAVSLGLDVLALPAAPATDWRSLLSAALADASWCAVALAVYSVLAAPRSPTSREPRSRSWIERP
jgi:hypothetical protein